MAQPRKGVRSERWIPASNALESSPTQTTNDFISGIVVGNTPQTPNNSIQQDLANYEHSYRQFQAAVQRLGGIRPSDREGYRDIQKAQEHLKTLRILETTIRSKGGASSSLLSNGMGKGNPVSKHSTKERDISSTDEVPFTDSGYASLPNPQFSPTGPTTTKGHLSKGSPAAEQDETLQDDAQTVYSTGTSIAPVRSRRYVLELAQDIYDKTRKYLTPEAWPMLSNTLPDLIKALALKIGQEESSQMNRQIMCFVHKRQEIFTSQLKYLCLDSDDALEIHKKQSGGLTLAEKMALWQRKETAKDPTLDERELFEGVQDEEDVDTKYSHLILNSPAYEWFISSLQRECSLQWDKIHPDFTSSRLRHEILTYLPTGTVSKRRMPAMHEATFRVRWVPLVSRLRNEITQDGATSTSYRTATFTTITCSPNAEEFQLMTVKEYMRQTWHSDGTEFLEILQKSLNIVGTSMPRQSSASMSDDTHITTIIQGEYLYVNVSGMAYSIAERGEQLAWLACVLRPLRFSGPNPVLVYTSPSIKSLSQSPHETVPDSISTRQNPDSIRKAKEDDVHVHNGTGNEKPLSPIREWHRHGLVQRAFTIEISEEIVPYTAQEGPLWYILLQPPIVPIIARGFPTARRPEPRPGLEIPFHILCRSIGASNSIIRHGHILLNGNLINLVASEKMGDVCFWQPSESSPNSDARAVYEDGRFLHERKSYGLSSSEIGELDLEKCRHVVCCWAGNQSSEINDYYSVVAASTVGSWESSLSDCMLSVGSNSQNTVRSGNGPGFCFFRGVFQRSVIAFEADFRTRPTEKTSTLTSQRQGQPRRSSQSGCHQNACQQPKRQRQDEDRDDCGSDGGYPPSKRQRNTNSNCLIKPRFLACPFWKRDPVKHWECFFKKITTISYVKQHLSRRHTPKFYCERCFSVFDDETSHDWHVMNASCQRGAIAKLEGISHAQRNRLSRHLHGSVEDKWLAIWRILFPDHEPPVSIFVDADQSEDFCLFREFVQREGHVMVYDELEGTNRFLRPGVSPVELHHALRTVLDVMFERFRLERQDAPRHSQESEILSIHGGTSSAVLSRQENRGSSPGDSGVGMRSRNSFAGSTETDISTPRPTSSNRIRPSPQTDLALLYGDDLLGHAAPHSIDVSHEASVGDIGNSGDYSQLDKSGEAISTHESASNSVECFDDIFPSSMVSLRGESDLPNLDDILYDITDTRTVDDFSEFR